METPTVFDYLQDTRCKIKKQARKMEIVFHTNQKLIRKTQWAGIRKGEILSEKAKAPQRMN
ncbi:hypothetical protein L0337_08460 [candidate division KSB1 bacterium]|nr:hypothetical protein [candidate division KSB1 bacterium]